MTARSRFIALLRELGHVPPDEALGYHIKPIAVFGPKSLDDMQEVFDQACRLRHPVDKPIRDAIATAVFNCYRDGVQDRDRLLAAAMLATGRSQMVWNLDIDH